MTLASPHRRKDSGEIMNLRAFAEMFRLRIRLDECGDPIIPGRRGQSQLYFDGDEDGELCLMVLDGPLAQRSRWQALGGKLWLGDISPHARTNQRVQDVKITGIPLENAKLAIKMARVKVKRRLSEADREAKAARMGEVRAARKKAVA